MVRTLVALRLLAVLALTVVGAAAGTRLALGTRAPRWTTAAGALALVRDRNPVRRLQRGTTAMVRNSPLFRRPGRARPTKVWRR